MNKIKEVVIISGKGGTGKTTVSAALADIMPNKVVVDADVDAANLHILLKPENIVPFQFQGKPIAQIDPDLCTQCGQCHRLCRFGAIIQSNGGYQVESLSCEGCQLCHTACPVQAVTMKEQLAGRWFTSQTAWGDFVYARLNPGGENSGGLVTSVRRQAFQIAQEKQMDTILIDGPPGIGCPVIAAITNTHLAVIVIEPTYSGISDLQRVYRLATHFKIKSGIVINRCDIDNENTEKIETFARNSGIPIYAKIPYSDCVREHLMNKELPSAKCTEFTKQVHILYTCIKNELEI